MLAVFCSCYRSCGLLTARTSMMQVGSNGVSIFDVDLINLLPPLFYLCRNQETVTFGVLVIMVGQKIQYRSSALDAGQP